SDTLAAIVARAMAKAPAARFQSAEEMAQALEAANTNATYRLPPSQPLNPTFQGVPPADSLTTPSFNRPSLYGQPSQVNAPIAASAYGPQPAFSDTPAYGSSARITHPSSAGMIAPPIRRPARRQPISYITAGVVLLLAIALILAKTGILPIFNGNSNASSNIAQAFTENFQNNNRNWTIGTLNNLTASIANNQYTLQIKNATNGQTYFPHPDVGTLPDKFTLTVSIEQTQADTSSSYGLAFRESEDANGRVSCYALLINTNATYQVLKYYTATDGNNPNPHTILGQTNQPFSAIKTGLGQFNVLQVVVNGNSFTFTINSKPLPGSVTPDTSYTGGQLAVFVSGTNATFVANQVTLSTP
ncbi:MAG TPA: hypothetical protein VJO32_09960, partial [Ktedonobacteraceae bacterium]|nr:hypothetical protein [Ktedonobacteraceae bacterium]